MDIKSKIKVWTKEWLEDKKEEWSAKKVRNLNGVCFESKDPLGKGKYVENMIHITQWVNGEGYDMSFTEYNQISKKQYDKHVSMNNNQVELMVAALNDLGYFN